MDGQVCGLETVHPLLTLNFLSTWILRLHVVSCCVFHLSYLCTKPFGDEAMDDGGRLRIELAASSSCPSHRRPWLDGR